MKYLIGYFLFLTSLNAMNCSDYKDFKLFNGHYYSVSIDKLTFDSAKQIAINNGGTLAIPNSQAENDFIKNLIGGGSIAWIGIYDPNKLQNFCYGSNCAYDSSRFRDVKNNSLLYKNFHAQQPDNLVKQYDVVDGKQMVSPLGEHWVAINGNNGQWLDFGNHADEYNNPVKYKAVFEFENLNECTPPTDDGVQELTGRFCNTKIWDTTIDAVTIGQTLDCQTDVNGNEYCPSALAQCGQSWDYDNGYSVSGVGEVVDYTNKVLTQTNTRCDYPATKVSASYQASIGSDPSKVGFNFVYAQTIGCGSVANSTQDDNHINGFKGVLTGSLSSVPANTKVSLPFTIANNQIQLCPYVPYGSPQAVTWSSVSSAQKQAVINSAVAGAPASSQYAYYFWEANGQGYAGQISASTNPVFDSGACTISFYNSVRGWAIFYNACSFSCPNGGTLSGNTCTTYQYSCPNGGTLNGNTCTKTCDTVNYVCPSGYTATTGAETSKGECKRTIEYTYYNYLCNNSQNTQGYNYTAMSSGGNCNKIDPNTSTVNSTTLDDACNSPTPPPNNCKREKFLCQANEQRPCSYVDNKWQCSPFPCFGQSNLENLDTNVGSSDKNNDGWTDDGNCSGTIYIFNGKSNKCRSWDMFFGLTGGGCCDKDKVAAGLVACKENEKLLAKKREKKHTHYIGNFCSKKIKLGFVKICVQKSDGYCEFNSSLARIIQEQGRPQLNISWGSAENPKCRGFTPEEFQKIDFSKIDLTEFVKDIQSSIQTSVIQNLSTYVKDKVEDFYGN